MTVLTSGTGFFFPRDHLLPSHIVGIISLVVLAVAIVALYVYRLAGAWRWIYVASAGAGSLSQRLRRGRTSFPEGVIPERARAETENEPPFVVAQAVVLVIFVVLGFVAARSFHPETQSARAQLGLNEFPRCRAGKGHGAALKVLSVRRY